MTFARLSSKGQIVIPKDLREKLGWKAGDKFEVRDSDGSVKLVRIRSLRELAGTLPKLRPFVREKDREL